MLRHQLEKKGEMGVLQEAPGLYGVCSSRMPGRGRR